MKISAIITGWNREAYFVDAIESVLEQRLQSEHSLQVLLVVDEDPADPCGEIADRYLPKVKVLRQKKNGTSSSRNFGMQHAEGDFFAFLDGDDFWHPDKLQKQLDYLLRHEDMGGIFCYERGFEMKVPRSDLIHSQPSSDEVRPAINASSFLGRAELWDLVGSMDESLLSAEFVEWWGRAKSKAVSSHVIEDVLVYRRSHESNQSRQTGDVHQNYLKILKQHLERKRQSQV